MDASGFLQAGEDDAGDGRGIEAIGPAKVALRTDDRGKSPQSTTQEQAGGRAGVEQRFRHGSAHSSVERMLFDGHDAAGFAGCGFERGSVERLDGVNAQYAAGDAICFEKLRRAEGFTENSAGGGERDVAAIADRTDAAPLEFFAECVSGRRGGFIQTEVRGTWKAEEGTSSLGCLP